MAELLVEQIHPRRTHTVTPIHMGLELAFTMAVQAKEIIIVELIKIVINESYRKSLSNSICAFHQWASTATTHATILPFGVRFSIANWITVFCRATCLALCFVSSDEPPTILFSGPVYLSACRSLAVPQSTTEAFAKLTWPRRRWGWWWWWWWGASTQTIITLQWWGLWAEAATARRPLLELKPLLIQPCLAQQWPSFRIREHMF